ncbi:MAG: TM2 domain-containing protein [Thermoproteota archaeon]|nr:TM2 domain-containing protein [Thermoproteota archaeon]
MVQVVAPFKSGGIAFILAFFFGMFLFNGIGHMYIGKVRRGIGILVLGWVIYLLLFVFLLSSSIPLVTSLYNMNFNQEENNNSLREFDETQSPLGRNMGMDVGSNWMNLSAIPLFSLVTFGIVFLVFWIAQAADANRLAKRYNRHLEKTGEVLWY